MYLSLSHLKLKRLFIDPSHVRGIDISFQDNLVNASNAIADRIREITQDYQFGFGSFSDKPTAPFASEKSYYEKNNKCELIDDVERG